MNFSYSDETTNERATKFVLFLLSPIISLLYGFKNINSKSTYTVFWFFIALFGFALVFDGSVRSDGLFIAFDFQSYEKYSFADYLSQVQSFFTAENSLYVKDIYEITLQFVVSRFTNNYHIFFMVVAMIYATLMLKSLKYFASIESTPAYCFFVLLYIFFSSQIYQIAGVRFGTASWLTILCVLKIFVDGNYRWFIPLCLTPLIHLSFLFFLSIVVIGFFTMRMEKMWSVLLVLSFFFSELAAQLVDQGVALINLPFLELWAENYTDENSIVNQVTAGSGFYWVTPIFKTMERVYYLIIMLLFKKNYDVIKNDDRTNRLYLFLVVWYTIANFCMAVPHLGLRFMNLSHTVVAFIWLITFGTQKYSTLLKIYPIVFLLSLKNVWDIYSGTLETSFLLSPLITIYNNIVNYIPVSGIPINF